MERAVRFIISQQNTGDGLICDTPKNRLGLTSLALLALAAAGHQPDYPTAEGRAMKRALVAILQPQNQDKDGYFGGGDGSRMYGHGITTLLLAELLG